jgi:acetyl-CoA C-acetyltransferase
MSQDVWIVDGVRSPFGRFGGGLREVPVVELGAQAVQALLKRTGWPVAEVSELNLGMAMIEGGLMVPARQIAMAAGLPETVPTLTLDRACCSGMTTVGLGWRAIRGGASAAVAVGLESMSQTPRLLHETRWGSKRGDLTVEDLLMLRNPLASGMSIARSAGEEAVKRGVDRAAQDEWAVQSHERYFRARAAGFFDDEITPIITPGGDEVRADEQPRADSSREKLARLTPVYGSPTVTAGNAPGLNDGAVAMLLAGSAAVAEQSAAPLAKVVSHLQMAGGPTDSVFLPGTAISRLLEQAGLSPDQVDVIEINEAYAATAVVSVKTLAQGDPGLEKDLAARTNTNGGAVAIGHPTGASGARIVLTAARRLRRDGARWGVAAICGGFGQTDAILLEAAR